MLRSTRQLLDLWHAFGLGRVPSRDRFKASHFPTLLPHLIQVQVADRFEDYCVPLAGSAVEEWYGDRLSAGKLIDVNVGQAYTEEILKDYEVCANERRAVLSRQWFKVGGAGPFEVERLLLPFDDNGQSGRVGLVIGAFFYKRQPTAPLKDSISTWVEEERHLLRPLEP